MNKLVFSNNVVRYLRSYDSLSETLIGLLASTSLALDPLCPSQSLIFFTKLIMFKLLFYDSNKMQGVSIIRIHETFHSNGFIQISVRGNTVYSGYFSLLRIYSCLHYIAKYYINISYFGLRTRKS